MTAAPKLGSGARFKKLSASLAARGAHNPDALAAWIGRRKYGAKKMGGLSHHSLSQQGHTGILLADGPAPYHRDADENVQCPNCHLFNDSDARWCDQCGSKLPGSAYAGDGDGTSGANLDRQPEALRTPDRTTTAQAGTSPQQFQVRAAGVGLSARHHTPIELAGRMPIQNPSDVVISRNLLDGSATVRHRVGGTPVGRIWRNQTGTWQSALDGIGNLDERTHQRSALADLIGNWNRSVTTMQRPGATALQPPPQQTPLMQQWGIPAIRALANSDGDGSDGDAADPSSGLTAKGKTIFAKLRAKGWPADRALKFAKNAQNMQSGQFRKAS